MQDDSVIRNEVGSAASDELAQFANEITAGLEACRKGRPNLKDAHVERAKALSLGAKAVANVQARWQALEKELEAKPAGQKLIRRLPKLGLLPISGPLPKPPPQGKAAEINQEPQIDAALKVFEEPQSKCEPVVPTGFTQSPTIAPVVADDRALCLDPAAPFDNAQRLVSLRAWHPGECIRTWQFWQKSFWQWSGTHWCETTLIRT